MSPSTYPNSLCTCGHVRDSYAHGDEVCLIEDCECRNFRLEIKLAQSISTINLGLPLYQVPMITLNFTPEILEEFDRRISIAQKEMKIWVLRELMLLNPDRSGIYLDQLNQLI